MGKRQFFRQKALDCDRLTVAVLRRMDREKLLRLAREWSRLAAGSLATKQQLKGADGIVAQKARPIL
jgi:hypothetical protein